MYKLLIVDDEKIIRESIAECIDWQHQEIQIVGSCKNGFEALDIILDTAPDIVLTDIRMPGMDGLELVSQVKKIDPYIRFVILTGYPDFNYARKAIQYGVDDYLLKPVIETTILQTIDKVKATLPVYCDMALNNLIAQLVAAKKTGNQMVAAKAFKSFLDRFQEAERFRPMGIQLLMELHTRFPGQSFTEISVFTEKFFTEYRLDVLSELLTKHIMEILFYEKTEKSSLSQMVKEYVHRHLDDENLSLKYIAENHLYINVNYLSRTFARQTGENFSNYLNRTRVEKSKQLLGKTDNVSVYKIAEELGFGKNPHYFSQVFKKYTGMTPSQYLEMH